MDDTMLDAGILILNININLLQPLFIENLYYNSSFIQDIHFWINKKFCFMRLKSTIRISKYVQSGFFNNKTLFYL